MDLCTGIYNYMRRVFVTVVIVTAFATPTYAKKVLRVRPAEKYSAKQKQGDVIVAVKPYLTPKEKKIILGTTTPYMYGVLPILVVLHNGSDHGLDLKDLKVRFITPDREGLEPLTEKELLRFRLSTKPNVGLLAELEISEQIFKAPIIPPRSTVNGFFYYLTRRGLDIIAGGSVYLSGIQNLTTGKKLPYFEIKLKK